MDHHNLKIYLQHYRNVRSGTKTFEIRKNDRAFQKGDTVTLQAFCGIENKYYDRLSYPELDFKIGDVYPIDSERVVFSLLKILNE